MGNPTAANQNIATIRPTNISIVEANAVSKIIGDLSIDDLAAANLDANEISALMSFFVRLEKIKTI